MFIPLAPLSRGMELFEALYLEKIWSLEVFFFFKFPGLGDSPKGFQEETLERGHGPSEKFLPLQAEPRMQTNQHLQFPGSCMKTLTCKHTHTPARVRQGGFTRRGRKNLDDITRDGRAVTDSNGEVRPSVNRNHLTYCSRRVGGEGGRGGGGAEGREGGGVDGR